MKRTFPQLCLSLLLGCSVQSSDAKPGSPVEAVPLTTMQTFEKDVLHSSKPVLVDFYATWCAPCKAMAPHISKIAQQYSGKIKVYRVDIDEDENLAEFYDVEAVPTFIVFSNGHIVKTSVGMVGPARITADIDDVIYKSDLIKTAEKAAGKSL